MRSAWAPASAARMRVHPSHPALVVVDVIRDEKAWANDPRR
ncbi:hypothetical protein [Planomonospora venezuelensis]|uniref:Uncharacterized protein n=1 Tax=Planomonospora venezuelensis TaxID=1999 RepID=A0A841DE17_PLAVE|nr:hypothetical protein [Planomonospora venezuelensis]MBB5965526.1 hypothetical protein [Planomonospora venezuelensis]